MPEEKKKVAAEEEQIQIPRVVDNDSVHDYKHDIIINMSQEILTQLKELNKKL